jgi:uncharacterized membrane protein YqjE
VRHHQAVSRLGLPLLFSALTGAFALIAYAGADHGRWVIAIAAAVIALWMGSIAIGALRRVRR